MARLIQILSDNKRTAALGVAIVSLLVAFGFDAAKAGSIVGAIVGIAAVIFASDGDTKAVIAKGEEPEVKP